MALGGRSCHIYWTIAEIIDLTLLPKRLRKDEYKLAHGGLFLYLRGPALLKKSV